MTTRKKVTAILALAAGIALAAPSLEANATSSGTDIESITNMSGHDGNGRNYPAA
jgi:hypothetical protein